MPHCIIEYSKPLELQLDAAALVKCVHQGVLASGLFEPDNIKTRALGYADFQVGSDRNNFIHVCVRLHSGRSAKQKKQLAAAVLQQLSVLQLVQLSITVEIVDMDTASYAKQRL